MKEDAKLRTNLLFRYVNSKFFSMHKRESRVRRLQQNTFVPFAEALHQLEHCDKIIQDIHQNLQNIPQFYITNYMIYASEYKKGNSNQTIQNISRHIVNIFKIY